MEYFISVAENLNKRQYEIRMPQGEEELENSFIKLEQGTMPQKEEDIIVDTYVLDELRLPHKLGGEIPLEFTFHGKRSQGLSGCAAGMRETGWDMPRSFMYQKPSGTS